MVFIYGPAQAITFATEVPQERNLLYHYVQQYEAAYAKKLS